MALSRKCKYFTSCKLYKNNSFNCNEEPGSCGNWRFIKTQEALKNYNKPMFQCKFSIISKYINLVKELYKFTNSSDTA